MQAATSPQGPYDVVVIGAGVAGLACACHLHAADLKVCVLEANAHVGGRVRTDDVEGFRLDHGFQVLLTAYPEAQAMLDMDGLQLGRFLPGARTYADGRMREVMDPSRRPGRAWRTAWSGVGTPRDLLRVLRLRRAARVAYEAGLPGTRSTAEALKDAGFSERMLERFLRPWLSGIYLERELETSERMLHFVMTMFARGHAALPAGGMQAIPDQLAASLPADAIHCGTRVAKAGPRSVHLENGTEIQARAVVIATDWHDAHDLETETPQIPGRRVRCLYFAAPTDPVGDPLLVLDGENRGPINNLCVPSAVAKGFAPDGQHLISVSVLGAHVEATVEEVKTHARLWFGDAAVNEWRHLRTYDIVRALPDQTPGAFEPGLRPVVLPDGRFICGDHTTSASLQGAMASGRRAANEVLTRVTAAQPTA